MVTVAARLMEHAAAEEHAEDLLRVNLLLEPVLAEAASAAGRVTRGLAVAWLLASHVVYFALLGVCQACISSGDFLERVCGLRRLILVWMQLDREFLVGLLDVVLLRTLGHAEYLVVITLAEDLAALLFLLRRILGLLWLCGPGRLRSSAGLDLFLFFGVVSGTAAHRVQFVKHVLGLVGLIEPQ